MHNLLLDPIIGVRAADTSVTRMSLPELYVEMIRDCVTAFPALRPHQRHAWHAFLCQLGVIALHRAGLAEVPESADQWRSLLRATTPEFADDQPWHLIVDDPGQPAFMQCPAPAGLEDYRGAKATPDDLDILLTAKNHEVKQTTAVQADPEDWMFALIDLQTMGGYLGAGNYQIARMNGGYSSRPCLGLAPAEGGPGAHLCCDIRRMLSGRDALLEEYPDYFRRDPGVALVWLEPWDGTGSLDLRESSTPTSSRSAVGFGSRRAKVASRRAPLRHAAPGSTRRWRAATSATSGRPFGRPTARRCRYRRRVSDTTGSPS